MADTESLTFYRPCLAPPPEPAVRLNPDDLDWRNGLLVRAPNWLGDSLMALPAVRRLREVVPEPCGIFVLCPAKLAPVWEAAGWVSRVLAMPQRRVRGRLGTSVRRLHAGATVVLPNSFGSALDVFGHGIPVRLGRAGRCRAVVLTHRLPAWRRRQDSDGCHHVSRYLELADAFGVVPRAVGAALGLAVGDAAGTAADLGMTADAAGDWLALAPGAAYGPAKQWPGVRFRKIAAWWLERGGRVVLVGTAGEQRQAADIVAGLNGALNLAGRTSLTALMAVLSRASLVLANDSGTMHLAAGLGVPGVAVFGSTDPAATGPLGAPWVVLRDKTACGPCFRRECARRDRPYHCLEIVTVERVREALEFVVRNAAGVQAGAGSGATL